jgi:hypothetical protein
MGGFGIETMENEWSYADDTVQTGSIRACQEIPVIEHSGTPISETNTDTAISMVSQWCPDGGVPIVVSGWWCPDGGFPTVVSRWWCPDGGVPMVVSRWWCPDGGVPMVVPRWWCPDGGAPVVVSR